MVYLRYKIKAPFLQSSRKAVAAIENVKAIHPEQRYQPLSFQIVGRHRRLPEFLTRKPSFYNVEKRVAIFYLSSSAVTCLQVSELTFPYLI